MPERSALERGIDASTSLWKFRRRGPDWFIALMMLGFGLVPIVGLWFVSPSPWVAIPAGLLATVLGIVGGCVAQIGEDGRG